MRIFVAATFLTPLLLVSPAIFRFRSWAEIYCAALHSNAPHIDLETGYCNDGNLQGNENRQVPITRSVGFNISFHL